MATSPINFDGAQYDRMGRTYRHDREGNEINVRHHQQITLADGTVYSKESPLFRWEKWIPNKEHRSRSTGSTGHYRKCNDRHAWLLDQAWKENFIAPDGVVDGVKESRL